MAETVVTIQYDGQEVQQSDVNALGNAARVDEYMIHELFRVGSYDGSVHKAVIPYRQGLNSTVVASAGVISDPFGTIWVYPHRVLVGSRVDSQTDPRANWHDVRSALFYTQATSPGLGPFGFAVSIASNSSGNPRWDLVYTRIDIDKATTVPRYRKDPVSALVTIVNSNPQMQSQASVGLVQGTPGATPAVPAPPADVPGVTYYVPLALVHVANGFNAASNRPAQADILDHAPCIQINTAAGHTVAVANGCNDPTLAPGFNAWGSSGARDKDYLPASMTGMHTLWVAIDGTGSPGTRTIDNTRDWRNRMFTVFASAGGTPGGGLFPWTLTRTSTLRTVPIHGGADLSSATNLNVYYNVPVLTNSLNDDVTTGASGPIIFYANNTTMSEIANTGSILLYVDRSTGYLMCTQIGTPAAYVFLRIDASSPFSNRGG